MSINMDVVQAREVLGVTSTTPPALVRRAWLQLVRQTHPDGNGGGDASGFVEVQSAYELLRDRAGQGVPDPPPRDDYRDRPEGDDNSSVFSAMDGMTSATDDAEGDREHYPDNDPGAPPDGAQGHTEAPTGEGGRGGSRASSLLNLPTGSLSVSRETLLMVGPILVAAAAVWPLRRLIESNGWFPVTSGLLLAAGVLAVLVVAMATWRASSMTRLAAVAVVMIAAVGQAQALQLAAPVLAVAAIVVALVRSRIRPQE